MQNFNPEIHDQRLFELTGQPVRKGRYTLEALILLGLDENGVSDAVEVAKKVTARIRTHTCNLPAAVGATPETQAIIYFWQQDQESSDQGGFLLIDWEHPQDVRYPEYGSLQN